MLLALEIIGGVIVYAMIGAVFFAYKAASNTWRYNQSYRNSNRDISYYWDEKDCWVAGGLWPLFLVWLIPSLFITWLPKHIATWSFRKILDRLHAEQRREEEKRIRIAEQEKAIRVAQEELEAEERERLNEEKEYVRA